MDINELFPGPDSRPDHPDFWKLAEIILALDASIDKEATDEEREKAWHKGVSGSFTDMESLAYMATQRAMRVLGISTSGQLRALRGPLTSLSAMWMEGYVVGSKFEQKRTRG